MILRIDDVIASKSADRAECPEAWADQVAWAAWEERTSIEPLLSSFKKTFFISGHYHCA